MNNPTRARARARRWQQGQRPQQFQQRARLWQEFREFSQELQEESTSAAPGRFEGSVQRESDGATFLRAIELGPPAGTSQSIKIYDQLGGELPSTPQFAGEALALGERAVFFALTDDIANRRFLSFVFGNFMFSISRATYHDGRPDVNLSGVLLKQ